MNITDIDDKIIKRARQNYLFEKYASEKRSLQEVIIDAKQVFSDEIDLYFDLFISLF